MLLTKLELQNFRQYIGEQSIDFSKDSEKNVTLILGKNTSGKTTLIQAFRWVLYNDSNFTGKKDDPKAVLNSDVAKGMFPNQEVDVKVTLTFEHHGITYELSRKYTYGCKSPGVAFLKEQYPVALFYYPNGERENVKGADQKLEEILPESLAEFFFFDGEKIAESRKPERVKDSINTIMGLVPLEHMIKHLVAGRTNVQGDLHNSLKSNEGQERIKARLNVIERDLKRAIENRDEAHNRSLDQSNLAENKRVEMEKIQDIAADAARLKDIDRKIIQAKERIPKVEDDIIAAFVPALAETFGNILSLDILKNISVTNYDDKGIPGMEAAAIQFLLKNGKCICGADLKNDQDRQAHLKDLLTYLPPESIGSQISHLKRSLSEVEISTSRQDHFHSLNENYNTQLDNLFDLEASSQQLVDKVHGNVDADKIAEQYKSAKNLREQFSRDQTRYEAQRLNLDKEKTAQNNELMALQRVDDFNTEIIQKLEYVGALFDRAEKTYNENSEGIFEEIQKTLTQVFNSMYHGSRTIELTPDYKVRLTVGGEHLDNSKGLDTVQNFAFIASLLKVAKDRADKELSSEPYPLAMDAVFSNTDENHIRNICKELPKLAQQAVLAIMDKDWTVAASSLEQHVGKKYRIEKISETHSEIREVE